MMVNIHEAKAKLSEFLHKVAAGHRVMICKHRDPTVVFRSDEESAFHPTRLPSLHRDPFDRLIVSQAIVHGGTILTPDPTVARYPARTMW